ncbi:hypothetical protein MJT46_015608 [Ovis ammon polii x Ovis aries]|nr:hypothetical protein MJT46_015608 [Ovis ammon polii x Ovis aries]
MSDRPAARRWGKCGPLCTRESIMVAFKGVWTQTFWKAVTAEFLAMLIFVLLSLGSTINWGGAEKPLPVDMVLISLCFGLSIATMVQCFGHISGGHINPAVTVAMVCTRRISIAKAVFYIAAQCLGAIIGAGILYLVTPPSVVGGLGVTTVHRNLSAGHGLLVELIITFQLVFTIFASCDSKRTDVTGSIALAIGISVAIGHLFAIYWVGPIIGAVLAGGLYEYVFCPDVELKRRFKEAFSKAAQQTKGSYMEVEDNRSQVETDDLILKPGVVHVIDIDRGEEKKGKDPSGEVLSSGPLNIFNADSQHPLDIKDGPVIAGESATMSTTLSGGSIRIAHVVRCRQATPDSPSQGEKKDASMFSLIEHPLVLIHPQIFRPDAPLAKPWSLPLISSPLQPSEVASSDDHLGVRWKSEAHPFLKEVITCVKPLIRAVDLQHHLRCSLLQYQKSQPMHRDTWCVCSRIGGFETLQQERIGGLRTFTHIILQIVYPHNQNTYMIPSRNRKTQGPDILKPDFYVIENYVLKKSTNISDSHDDIHLMSQ